MHVMIINGSPRIKKFSNTDKILGAFTRGLLEVGSTFEQYEVSDRAQWDRMRQAYYENKNIIIALPLFVECIPGLLLEFLETLTPKNDGSGIAYILQGGFAEGAQLRCGESYLKILTEKLGCDFKGVLAKGNNFSIRLSGEKEAEKITGPYKDMGLQFSSSGNFDSEECRKFTGPEYLSGSTRLLLSVIFKIFAKKSFTKMAAEVFGCTKPLDYKPY